MTARVYVVLQARMGSSRLPGKSLKPLQGRPLIAHVVERAAAIPGVDGVVLATSDHARDDLLAEAGGRLGVQVVRGSEADVLARMLAAARLVRADVVVRVTGDCPLLAPEVGGKVLDLFASGLYGYAWNDTARSGYPDGTDVEAFERTALEHAAACATAPADREHVTSWIRRHYPMATLRATDDWSSLKLSVDRPEDYARVARIAACVPRGALSLADTIRAAQMAGVSV